MGSGSIRNEDSFSTYISSIKNIPTLEKDEEFLLASKWKESGDREALNKIINSHLRLVLKIAKGYSGYGLAISDLVAEGNLGIMHAVQHFDPTIGYRFSTYAAWWIKAKIQEFIYNSWSIVKLSSTKSHKKLFFGFRKLKKLLGIESSFSDEEIKTVAKKIGVTEESARIAERRFSRRDFSVDSPVDDGSSGSTWVDFIEDAQSRPDSKVFDEQEYGYRKKVLHDALNTLSKKEYDVICLYRLSNPTKSLREIGQILNLSAERVRQLEKRAFLKIQNYVKSASQKIIDKTAKNLTTTGVTLKLIIISILLAI
ncbi:MAG: RNA polymerase factor sigma-32 [Alphaproteobacteria bacterium]|nr:RNA polymerase factor sigma-32 [Alphaproteobacteria bacterium]MBO7536959.1 RNA polymerase factor sigma-32 [Alphaproteobacteria bacterium]MBO7642021.1 RNA polymerase factor sigma-32 [Alphaproteobacteria bacterium]